MSGDRTEISPKQRRAVAALLTSGTVEQAARAANVGRDTLYRWMKDELFITELRKAESEAIAGLSRTLAGLSESAAQAFRDGLSESQPITIRLRAAEQVTGSLLKLRELVDIESRLAALERSYAEQKES